MKNKVKLYRKQAKIKQFKLAEILKISAQTLCSIENFNSIPSVELALNISKNLNKTVEELFFFTENIEENESANKI